MRGPAPDKLRDYVLLIKSPQTLLLVLTGMAGFVSANCPAMSWSMLLALTATLLLSISGSTVLNMVYDKDIDSLMARTCQRPLPAGRLSRREALVRGLVLSGLGVGWSFLLAPLYGLVVLLGLLFDVVVYTMWLKQKTPWSIIWGGIAGGMPILAGRTLATGQIDLLGILLSVTILFWIPTHMLTFSSKYAEDYRRAGVPVFPNVYGTGVTQTVVAVSTVLAVVSMVSAGVLLGSSWGYLRLLIVLGGLLVVLAVRSALWPSMALNMVLYKLASFYMLGAMGVLALG